MTRTKALAVLATVAGGIALVSAATAHLLWHGGRRISSACVLVCGALTEATLMLSALVPNFPLGGAPFHTAKVDEKVVALTFDDGPRSPYTQQILDVLAAEGVTATFFVLGENALRHPETLRRMAAEGHSVANHGVSHQILMWAGPAAALHEIAGADNSLRDAGVSSRTAFFRAPHGWLSVPARRALRRKGYDLVGWSKGVWDTACPGTERIVARTIEALRPGAILLLHDGWAGSGSEDRSQTVAALPAIIKGARLRGYTFVTVARLMEMEKVQKINEVRAPHPAKDRPVSGSAHKSRR